MDLPGQDAHLVRPVEGNERTRPRPEPDGKATYHANGGLFVGDIEPIVGTKYIEFDELPVCDRFRFLGCAESPDAAAPKYTASIKDILLYEELILYTVWEPINQLVPETHSNFMMYVFPWIILLITLAAYIAYRRWKAEGEDI